MSGEELGGLEILSTGRFEDLRELVHAVGAAKESSLLPEAEHAGQDGGQGGNQGGSAGLLHTPFTQRDHEHHEGTD